MTERPGSDEAVEAAQQVADSVESWESTAEDETVREALDDGLEQAEVEVPDDERDRLVEEISDPDEAPEVREASPDDAD